MIRLTVKHILTLGVLALAGTGTAFGQYTPAASHTAGGGNIITGNGSLPALGPGAPLSIGGFDLVTINLGAVASGASTDTILFATSNDMLVNNGFITAAPLFNGVSFSSTSSLSGETITNNGAIILTFTGGIAPGGSLTGNPGSNLAGGNIASAIGISSTGGINGIFITNNVVVAAGRLGGLTGGATVYGNYGGGDAGGNIATGISISSINGISGISITNNINAVISGGNVGGLISASNIYGNYIMGTPNAGGNIVTGIAITSVGAIISPTVVNKGSVSGGSIGGLNGGSYIYANYDNSNNFGGNIATGIAITSQGAIYNPILVNQGSVTGGSLGGLNASSFIFANFDENDAGANIVTGISVDSATSINGLSLSNSGMVSGGSVGGLIANSYIYGADDDFTAGGNIATGIAISSMGPINGLTLANGGTVSGGSIGGLTAGSYIYGNPDGENSGGNIATGIAISSLGTTNGVSLANGGAVSGGSIGGLNGDSYVYGNTESNSAGGNIATGIAISSLDTATGVSLANGGTVSGGSIGGLNADSYVYGNTESNLAGGNIATGIAIDSAATINQLTLSAGGAVSGGSIGGLNGDSYIFGNSDSNEAGGNIATGIAIDSVGTINGLAFSGGGAIFGGSTGDLDNSSYIYGNSGANNAGGNIATGAAISSFDSINGVEFKSSGLIFGGNAGSFNAGSYIFGNNGADNAGGNIATGAAISSVGAINMLEFQSRGAISGGNIGNFTGDSYIFGNNGADNVGGNIATGAAVTSLGSINGLLFQSRGAISGGNIGGLDGASFIYGNNGADNVGGNIATGVAITSGGSINGLMFKNYGSISGGSVGSLTGGSYITPNNGSNNVGGDLLSGVSILSASGGSNLFLINVGTISGGNSVSGNAGAGISANTGNLVIKNWGGISAGSGLNPVAIQLQGANNTVNLEGHSFVNGLISAPGSSNNVLNIHFTGMSPAAQAALINQLLAQGDFTNFTGTFTVRGVTYHIDPMVLPAPQLSSYQVQGLTPNQKAIGANLDSLTYNPVPGTPFANLLNAIDQSGNVPAALEELSPQKYEIYGDLAISNATATVQSVDARLNNLRDGSESVDTTGMGGGVEVGALVTGDGKDGGGKESKAVVQAPQEKRWGFFASGEGLLLRSNTQNVDLQNGKANTVGTTVGVDGKVGEHGVIGALFAYDNADVILGGDGSHATIESYTGGLYGSWHQDGFYANTLAAYTRNTYNSNRNILLPGFAGGGSGSTDGNQATVNLDGGYDYKLTNRLTLGPIGGLQYVHLDIDSFNENGLGGGNLAVGSQSMDSLQSRLGGRLDYRISTSSVSSFSAGLYAAWQHEYLNSSRGIGASFQGTGLTPFSIQTSSPLRDAAVVGASLNFTFHDRLTLFTDYELQLWQASSFSQTITGGARISF